MEKRISSDDERRLTYAVKTAAMLVNSDPERDCNRVLADCLMENDVDSRFAKVASAAFNKQYTVTRFKDTPDDGKIAAFPLSDSSIVYGMMGGAMPKTASLAPAFGAFSISIGEIRTMDKTADVIDVTPRRPLYEETVSLAGFERHLASVMTKQASAHRELVDVAEGIEQTLAVEKDRLVSDMEKLGSFDRNLLQNVHAEKLNMLLAGSGMHFRKTANTGDPGTELSERIVKLAALARIHDDIVDGINSLDDGLREFSSSAASFGCDMAKVAGAAADIGALVRGISGAGSMAIQGLDSIRQATNTSLQSGFDNAKAMYQKGDDGYRPGKVLDAEFLVKDRFRDRMLGWSDMTADPLFAMYPSEQVFLATQKAMDMDPALERPDHRELLRVQVGQLLAQNNRASAADISALAATLKALSASDNTIAEDAAKPVLELEKKTGPDAPSTTSIFGMLNGAKMTSTKDFLAEAAKANQAEWDNAEKQKKEETEAREKELAKRPQLNLEGLQKYVKDIKAVPDPAHTGMFIVGKGSKATAYTAKQLYDGYVRQQMDLVKELGII